MSGKYVLIPLKIFQDLCNSTKKQGTKITGTIGSWSNVDQSQKVKSTKRAPPTHSKTRAQKKRKGKPLRAETESDSNSSSESTETDSN